MTPVWLIRGRQGINLTSFYSQYMVPYYLQVLSKPLKTKIKEIKVKNNFAILWPQFDPEVEGGGGGGQRINITDFLESLDMGTDFVFWHFSPILLLLHVLNVSGAYKKMYIESLYILSNLPSGSPWGEIGSKKCGFCVFDFYLLYYVLTLWRTHPHEHLLGKKFLLVVSQKPLGVGSWYLVGTLVRRCRCTSSWCDLDVIFDLVVVTLSLKILSGLYLGNRIV